MDKVDLAKIGLRRITSNSRSVFDRCSEVCVTFYAQPFYESDDGLGSFAKGMRRACCYGDYCTDVMILLLSLACAG